MAHLSKNTNTGVVTESTGTYLPVSSVDFHENQLPPKDTSIGAPNLSNVDTSGIPKKPYEVFEPAPNNQRTNPVTFSEFLSKFNLGNR